MLSIRFFAPVIAWFMSASVFAGELSGAASYRERIALPPEAIFQAILYDISNNGQVEIGRFGSPGNAGPPYKFTISYGDDAVVEGGRYAIKTAVILQEKPYFVAGGLLEGFPGIKPDINLVMVRPGVAPASEASASMTMEQANSTAIPSLLGTHGLRLPATFKGTVQADDRSETWHLTLADDQSFQLQRQFGESADAKVRSSLGHWRADPSRGVLILRDGAEMPLVVRPRGHDRLQVIDGNSDDAYDGELLAAETVEYAELNNIVLSGMMVYMADAAMLEECLTGTRFPVAMEGDYPALEKAYLADRPGPGEPLYVMLEGQIVERPAMEGPDRQTVVVDRYIRPRKDMNCDRAKADASLQNTYWRLEQLEGEPFPFEAAQREPHLLLEAGDSGKYRATAGCNVMRGAYTLEEGKLSLSAPASTLMACPSPLDQLERQFAQVLADSAGFTLKGQTLVLQDSDGQPRALFSAVYF